MGNTCTPMADSCQSMTKPIQYCKVISLKKEKKKVSKQIPIQTSECFSVEIDKPSLKFTWKCKGLDTDKETLRKKNVGHNGTETTGCLDAKHKP